MSAITTSYFFTNTSDKFILVGNYNQMIAAYDTREEAEADLDIQIPWICDSPWGVVEIVAPGKTIKGELCAMRPLTKSEQAKRDAEIESFFAQMATA
jgi:hypothetical protein